MNKFAIIILIFTLALFNCHPIETFNTTVEKARVKTGLEVLLDSEIDYLKNKNIALVTNQSGIDINSNSNVSLFLKHDDLNLIKIFSPEHGFSGQFANGEIVQGEIITNFPLIISLYGNSKKPTAEMLKDVDIIIYDIQDIGARFYTYISTLGLVMEAAAENNIPVMVLDRPNPIGSKIEGPVLNMEHSSFIGMYPIPTRYGMTIGEVAQMIVGERMIGSLPELKVIQMEDYKYQYFDEAQLPWRKPSPNIPNLETAIVYPGLCILEATNISEGRGTTLPFRQIGAPWIDSSKLIKLLNEEELPGVKFGSTEFTPISIPAMSKYPKYENELCYGINIIVTDRLQYNSVKTGIAILWAINKLYPDKIEIDKKSLARLWGSDILYKMLMNGDTVNQIDESYRDDILIFSELRKQYQLYN